MYIMLRVQHVACTPAHILVVSKACTLLLFQLLGSTTSSCCHVALCCGVIRFAVRYTQAGYDSDVEEALQKQPQQQQQKQPTLKLSTGTKHVWAPHLWHRGGVKKMLHGLRDTVCSRRSAAVHVCSKTCMAVCRTHF